LGAGLEHGLTLEMVRGHYKWLVKKDPQRAQMVLRCLAGGWWTEDTRASAFDTSEICMDCSMHVGSAFHHLWSCLHVHVDRQGVLDAAAHLITPASSDQCPGYWCRGLLPAWAVELPTPAEAESWVFVGALPWAVLPRRRRLRRKVHQQAGTTQSGLCLGLGGRVHFSLGVWRIRQLARRYANCPAR